MVHEYGNALRISPQNNAEIDGYGGKGKFAKWIVHLDQQRGVK